MPLLPTLCPHRCHPEAQHMQKAFNGLLRWALDLPSTTRLELLHCLANLPPVGTLVAKQLVWYRASLYPPSGHYDASFDMIDHLFSPVPTPPPSS